MTHAQDPTGETAASSRVAAVLVVLTARVVNAAPSEAATIAADPAMVGARASHAGIGVTVAADSTATIDAQTAETVDRIGMIGTPAVEIGVRIVATAVLLGRCVMTVGTAQATAVIGRALVTVRGRSGVTAMSAPVRTSAGIEASDRIETIVAPATGPGAAGTVMAADSVIAVMRGVQGARADRSVDSVTSAAVVPSAQAAGIVMHAPIVRGRAAIQAEGTALSGAAAEVLVVARSGTASALTRSVRAGSRAETVMLGRTDPNGAAATGSLAALRATGVREASAVAHAMTAASVATATIADIAGTEMIGVAATEDSAGTVTTEISGGTGTIAMTVGAAMTVDSAGTETTAERGAVAMTVASVETAMTAATATSGGTEMTVDPVMIAAGTATAASAAIALPGASNLAATRAATAEGSATIAAAATAVVMTGAEASVAGVPEAAVGVTAVAASGSSLRPSASSIPFARCAASTMIRSSPSTSNPGISTRLLATS